jgi:hypothetical protein
MICKICIAVYVQPLLWQGLRSYGIRWTVATGKAQFSQGDRVKKGVTMG